ncbi:MAG TPA: GGDEF domain-containing protein, partial [Acidimicrobiales bacterium]|nr:GGDEF domain-containing protein [Acidimicrobiales bacterium]
ANKDALTGLVNRRVFFEEINSIRHSGAVLYCDLDHFKPINDELGHATGDRVLQIIASRILACVRSADLVGRLGGDEFAVLCERATRESAKVVAERIRAAISAPIELDGRMLSVGVTIGIAHSDEALTADSVEDADRALRAGKAEGRLAIREAAPR